MNNSLIYGKNSIQKIVSIEPRDGSVEIFTEDSSGVHSEIRENRYWILSDEKIGKSFVRLNGNLHYKYGAQFDTRDAFIRARSYLKKNDIYSIWNEKEALMVKDGYSYHKGLEPKDVSILAFDIETTGIKHNENSKLLIIANTFRRNGVITRKLFAYDDYKDEGEMIVSWTAWVREMNPSILCGHNIFNFDFLYIKYIAEKFNISLDLGRDGSELRFNNKESKFRLDGTRDQGYRNIQCYGREILDTYFMSIRHDTATKKYESYGLKQIIAQEGLEEKDRVFYDAATIKDNYLKPEEWTKIKKYAEFDGDDALKLFDLMGNSFFYMAQSIPKSFQQIVLSAPGSQINSMLVRSYLQDGHSIPKADEINNFMGAISWGNPGIFKNGIKWDIASLYPSIVITYKIFDKNKDPNGHFLKLVEKFRELRLEYKKLGKTDKKYEDMQQSFKILINSAYGACSTRGLNFNYPKGASEITRYGREILDKAIVWATSKEYKEWNPNA